MDRTEASIAPARGGDRTDRRHRCRVPVGRMLFVLVVVGLCIVGPWTPRTAEGASKSKTPAPAGPSQPTLTLLAPPTIAGPTSPFTVPLAISGAVPLSELSLGVTVYNYLRDISSFNETLGGSPVGSVAAVSGAPIALSSLPPDPGHENGVDLSLPVTAGGVMGTGTGPFTVDLQCQLGSCGGVYPVRLELTDTATDTVTSRLLTYLVYTVGSADIEPLQLALVVPLTLPAVSSPATGAAPAVTSSSLGTLTKLLGALSQSPTAVPLTLAPSPATMAALAGDRRTKARAVLASLVALAGAPGRQTLCGAYVPVDANSLVTPALAGSTELAAQIRRGAEVLDVVPGLHTDDCVDNAWVTSGGLSVPTLDALGALGFNNVVAPPGAVAGPGPSTTPVRRFTIVGAPKQTSAILSDPGLTGMLQGPARGDPALVADQFLAEIELDYYEAPNTPEGRGVVVAPPADWQADADVVADVLSGLEGNPMIAPVTLATLFSDTAGVPVGGVVGGVTQAATRRMATTDTPDLPAASIASARSRLTGFASAVAGPGPGAVVATSLGDFLLATEGQELTVAERHVAIVHFDAALDQQLALLSISSPQVRLTASTGSVPITVIKNAPYPVKAVLTLTSDNIAFSAGGDQVPNSECATPVVTDVAGRSNVSTLCTFVHGTNAVYIEMRSRVSGDFRMSIALVSPEGGLQMAGGEVTVSSSSTLAVAIALSVAAGAVLLWLVGTDGAPEPAVAAGSAPATGGRRGMSDEKDRPEPENIVVPPPGFDGGDVEDPVPLPPAGPISEDPISAGQIGDSQIGDSQIGDGPDSETDDDQAFPGDQAGAVGQGDEGPDAVGPQPGTGSPVGADTSGIGRATAVMAVGTTLSRVTGVIRIVAVGYALGSSSHLADAYNLANTLPNIIHDIVLGGVLSATFIPVFVHRLTTRDDDEAWEAISAVTSVTLIVIAAASVVFLLLTPFIIDATTTLNHSAQAAQDRQVATELLLLFVPQLTGYGFISLGTALLNARRRFGAPMFSSIANNVVLIVVLLYYAFTVNHAARSIGGLSQDRNQLLLLGLGTTAGVVAQAGLMVPSLRRAGLHLSWRPDFHHEAVRTILRLSGWTFGLVVANQVALIVVLTLAGRVQGAVMAYTYAWTFFQLPYGVVAVSVMAATAPELTALWSRGDFDHFRRRMATGLRTTMAIVVPAAAGMLILSHPLVALLFAHGATTVPETLPTALALALLSLGLPGFCVFLYAVRVLQSVQDLRSAFWLYVLENGINIVAALVLVGPLGVVRGIAVSISIAYTVSAVVALAHVRTRVHGLDGDLVVTPLVHVVWATVALVVAAALGSNISASQSTIGLLLRVVVGTVAGGGAFIVAAGLLGGRGRRPPTAPPPRGGTRPPDGPPPRSRRRPGLPPRPDRLPPAGRPPMRPSRLGPTRGAEPDGADHGRLGA